MTTIVRPQPAEGFLTPRMKNTLGTIGSTLGALIILLAFLMPLGYGLMTALKTDNQLAQPDSPVLPSSPVTFTYEGQGYDVFEVPLPDGGMQELALVRRGREDASFVDPANPGAGLIEWEGRWRTLDRVWELDIQWSNFPEAWTTIDFLKLLRNTLFYCILSTVGAVASSAFVAFGFSRYEFRGKSIFFAIVMGTIILPGAVTLVPTYYFFNRIGWVGTWAPLIVPVYFANAYNIFLLRQFFLGIPLDLDEAATIDGAGPLRTFWSVILPNARPALVAVTLFHFFFAWNDFFLPLVYLAGKPNLVPITVGLTGFSNLYDTRGNLVQAASLIASVIPLIIFFFAQRVFLEGISVAGAGVEK